MDEVERVASCVAELVSGVDARAGLRDDRRGNGHRNGGSALERLRQKARDGVSFEVLHDLEELAPFRAELENVNHVRMTESGDDVRFLHEHAREARKQRKMRQNALDRYRAFEPEWPAQTREKHFGHTARRKLADDLIVTYPSSRVAQHLGAFTMALVVSHLCFVPIESARAEPREDDVPHAREDSTARQRAIALFVESEAAYRTGRFRQAVELLEQSYALVAEPVLLYNLARAYEALGDGPGAIDAYERYLSADPDVADRESIEQRVAALRSSAHPPAPEAAVAPPPARPIPAESAVQQPPKPPADAPAASSPQPKVSVDSATSWSLAPWVTVGVGGALLSSALVLDSMADARHERAQRSPDVAGASEAQSDAEALALSATVVGIAGATVAAAGLGFLAAKLLLDRRTNGDASRTRFVLGSRSAAVSVRF